jgi:hypothetical protein
MRRVRIADALMGRPIATLNVQTLAAAQLPHLVADPAYFGRHLPATLDRLD